MAEKIEKNEKNKKFAKHGWASVAGSEVLRWRISLPLGGEGIGDFYREIGERAVGYCEGALTEQATQEFEQSDDPNKRFRFPVLSYHLAGEVTYEDECFLSVLLTAELRRRGERAPIVHFEDGQVWEKEGGVLLPPDQLVRTVCQTGFSHREKKRCRGVLLSEKVLLWYDGETWNKKELLSCEKNTKNSCHEMKNMV